METLSKKSFSEQKIFKWGPDLSLISMYYKALVLNTELNLIIGLPQKNTKFVFLIHFSSSEKANSLNNYA